ncbi:hypothetical protein IJG73_01235 [Candidatus Saccharibacteria bacterium]|nr:hypothetical protein [Candidatus Saccharibacteria bacterium]
MSTSASAKNPQRSIIAIILVGIIALIAIAAPAVFFLQQSPSEDGSFAATTNNDRSADAAAKKFLEQYPVINVLPIIYAHYDEAYNYTEFRVDGGQFDDCSQDFCLKITDTTGGNFDFAKELITAAGHNPDDYELLYEYKPIVPLE